LLALIERQSSRQLGFSFGCRDAPSDPSLYSALYIFSRNRNRRITAARRLEALKVHRLGISIERRLSLKRPGEGRDREPAAIRGRREARFALVGKKGHSLAK
jgi:hypothetical protein